MQFDQNGDKISGGIFSIGYQKKRRGIENRSIILAS
jgi:hypothetical protein